MTIGATLQQARADRDLVIEQVVRRTRIPVRIVTAMEQDDWERVPPGIFARGYIRAFAREVGLDGDALVAQYDAQQAPPPAPEEVAPPAAGLARPVVVVRWPALPEEARHWLAGPAFVVLLLLVYLAGRMSAPDARPVTDDPDVVALTAPGSGASTEAPRPTGTSGVTRRAEGGVTPAATSPAVASLAPVAGGPGAPVAAADVPLALDVEVIRPCWVTASADASRVIYKLLQPGERVQARGHVFTLRVGDAGALRLSLDGAPARPLGGNGEVVSVRITRDNYRSLLPDHAGN